MIKKDWLIGVIITLITVLAWVTFDIIHARSQVEIPAEIQSILEPIELNFNTQVLDNLP